MLFSKQICKLDWEESDCGKNFIYAHTGSGFVKK